MMFPRIVNAQYPRLEHASDTARDLLSRLLVAKPGVRLGICEIMSHPWFLKDLPKARPPGPCTKAMRWLACDTHPLILCSTPAKVPAFKHGSQGWVIPCCRLASRLPCTA